MEIVRACPADVDDLQKISWRTFYEAFHHLNKKDNMDAYMNKAFDSNQLLDELKNEYSEFYFAKDGEAVLGYIKVNRKEAQTEFKDDLSLEVERIYVEKEYQGTGLGARFMQKIKELATEYDLTYIWLGVWEKNPDAIRFYERHGFNVFSSHEFVMGDEIQIDNLMVCKVKEI